MLIIISILFMTGSKLTNAQTSSEIYFKDKNLQTTLCKFYKHKGAFTKAEASELSKKIKYVDLDNANISDLEGLQYFKNLVNVDISGNELTNFRPLTKLNNLRSLDISCNSIQGKRLENILYNMSKIKNLEKFTCEDNGINNIDFLSKIGNIENYSELYLANNKISDISVLKSITKLDHLDLSNNHITDVTSLQSLKSITYGFDLRDNCIIDYKPVKHLIDAMLEDAGNETGIEQYDYYKNPVDVIFEDETIKFPNLTAYYKYQTYVEAIPLFEAIGGSANYNVETGTLICNYNGNELIIKNYAKDYLLNGKKMTMNYEMRKMQYNLAYVPVKDICNALGLEFAIINNRDIDQPGNDEIVNAPELVEIIDRKEYMKTDNGDYTYVISNDNICIIEYNGNEENVVIPSQINDTPVTYIKDGAFSDDKSLISVEIPKSVSKLGTSWGNGVFSDCWNLESIKFDTGTENAYIGASSFRNCINLTSIVIPGNYITLYDNAFESCTNLNNVKWENSSSIEQVLCSGVFSKCMSLATVSLPANIINIGSYAFRYSALASITIPEGTKSIGEGAFEASSLTSIIIPSTVRAIGNSTGAGAFNNCTKLSEVILKDGNEDTYIGANTFYYCTSLKSIIIPGNYNEIDNSAFAYCSSLKSVKYEKSSLTNNPFQIIGENAFCECNELKYVSLSDSLKIIGEDAFIYCEQLRKIVIPQSVSIIGDGAFCECPKLSNVLLREGTQEALIGGGAFCGCHKLESITIPGNYSTIGESAFYNCINLKSVIYQKSNAVCANQIICDSAFNDCSSLESISLPTTLRSIGEEAFSNCSGLKQIAIPEGVTSIGDQAFESDFSLISISLPSTLTEMGECVFWFCYDLKTVTIPTGNNKLYIGGDLFFDCISLTSVYIGENVKSSSSPNALGFDSVAEIYSKSSIIKKMAKSSGLKIFCPASNYVNGESLFGTVIIKGKAKVGNRLMAVKDAMVPIGANVSYKWTINGKVVSRTRSYTINKNDIGNKITLTITGIDGYKGCLIQSIKITK